MKTTAASVMAQNVNFEGDTKAGNSRYCGCTVITSPTNCKLSTIEGIESICSGTAEQMKYKMDEVLKHCRILAYVHTRLPNVKEFIEKNYEIYESVKVPVGYSGGYQYHIHIRNKIGTSNPNMRPSEFGKKTDLNKDKIKTVLTNLLKAKRRKTDVVDELLNNL